jgi:hypothetical protein
MLPNSLKLILFPRGQTTKALVKAVEKKAERSYVELSRCSSADIPTPPPSAMLAAAVRKKKPSTATLRSSLDSGGGETVNIYLMRTQSGDSMLSNGGSGGVLSTVAPTGGSIRYHKGNSSGDLYARRLSSRLAGHLLTNGHHR